SRTDTIAASWTHRATSRHCFLVVSTVMSENDAQKRNMAVLASRHVPHNEALGIRIVEVANNEAVFELPYDAKLVGNPDTGAVHGGAITAMLDACSGFAVFAALVERVPIATLDLRIDYLKAAAAG